ncbi:MAG: hypothetical protein ACLT76_01250 [Clostridium fessum]
MQQFFSNFRRCCAFRFGCLTPGATASAPAEHKASHFFIDLGKHAHYGRLIFIESPSSLEFAASFRSPTCPSASDRWQRSLPFLGRHSLFDMPAIHFTLFKLKSIFAYARFILEGNTGDAFQLPGSPSAMKWVRFCILNRSVSSSTYRLVYRTALLPKFLS